MNDRVCAPVCVKEKERQPDSLCFYLIFVRNFFFRPKQKKFLCPGKNFGSVGISLLRSCLIGTTLTLKTMPTTLTTATTLTTSTPAADTTPATKTMVDMDKNCVVILDRLFAAGLFHLVETILLLLDAIAILEVSLSCLVDL